MMEALEQQETKIESNLEDAAAAAQQNTHHLNEKEEEIRDIVENVENKNSNNSAEDEKHEEHLSKNEVVDDASETTKNVTADAETGSDGGCTDHNVEAEEKEASSTQIAANEATTAAEIAASPDAPEISAENCVDLNSTNLKANENCEKRKSPKNKITLVDYDDEDEDEEELLKSDDEMEAKEREVQIDKGTTVAEDEDEEVVDIFLEKESAAEDGEVVDISLGKESSPAEVGEVMDTTSVKEVAAAEEVEVLDTSSKEVAAAEEGEVMDTSSKEVAATEEGEVMDISLEKEIAAAEEGEVMDISLEKEAELLNSDEEEFDSNINVETTAVNELTETVAEIDEIDANKDKEVFTISDEEQEEEHISENAQEQAETEQQLLKNYETSNKFDEAENPAPSNEVINLDDDDDDSQQNAAINSSAILNDNKISQISKAHTNEAEVEEENEIGKQNSPQQIENYYNNEQRLLYKFEIDDSNDSSIRQSDCRVPRDDDMDEESHDTFASINDDSRQAGTGTDSNQDANLKLLAASAEKLKDRADAEMDDKEDVVIAAKYEAPKINGDHHKSTQETETDVKENRAGEEAPEEEFHDDTNQDENEAVINDPNSELTQSAVMLPSEEFFSSAWSHTRAVVADNSNTEIYDSNPEQDLQKSHKLADTVEQAVEQQQVQGFNESAETWASNEAADVNVVDDIDDEASRCSSLASSVATSETSSSHQLVIDHPMEDLVEARASSNTADKLLVAPLKLTLKRKLSNSSNTSDNYVSTSPLHKLPHLELNDVQENCEVSPDVTQHVQIEIPLLPQNHLQPVERQEQEEIFEESAPQPPFKSLLLEQLQKPRTPPVPMEPFVAIDTFVAPLSLLPPPPPPPPLPQLPPPALPAPMPTVAATKYLCFKCKLGCFDSFAALTEHQLSCLASSMASLFPPMQLAKPTTAQNTPPTIVAPQPLAEPIFVAPATPPPPPQKIRYYKCSSCGTFHENWNLFLHVREKHNRHMCLYCIRFFPTAEKLSLHLEIKHDLEQNHFNSEQALRISQRPKDGLTGSDVGVWEGDEMHLLMCCTCQHIFRKDEPFSDHICSEYMSPCTLCGQKGRHTNQCKAHPDAKRRVSKVKKKTTKQRDGAGASAASDMGTQRSQFSSQRPSTSSHNSSYCDNQQQQQQQDSPNAPSTNNSNFVQLPPPPPISTIITTMQAQQNEDSNDSSNMVIDESCSNTTHHANSLVNPFKALDERERADAERQFQSTPDRGANEVKEEKPIKLKLCVPRIFQKPVEAAISSTDESEEGEEEDENEENTTTEENKESMPIEARDESIHPVDTNAETSRPNWTITGATADNEDDESLEEAPNTTMKRIAAEIELTQLAIQHTKKSRHHAPKPPTSSSGSTPRRQGTLSQSSNRTTERNWTPTPPASPNSRWSHSEQNSKVAQHRSLLSPLAEVLPPLPPQFPLPPLIQQERRDTIGSDAMDIDETITGNSSAITPEQQQMQSPPENPMQTSSENLDTSAGSGSTILDIEHNSSIEENSNHLLPLTIQNTEAIIAAKSLDIDESLIKPEAAAAPANDERHDDLAEHQPSSIIAEATENKVDDHDQEQEIDVCDDKTDDDNQEEKQPPPAPEPQPPVDGIEVAQNDMPVVDLLLDRPLEKFEIVEFVRICLKAVYPICLYCNHARRIAVNGRNLVLHMIAAHTFTATVDSITAEELQSETIVAKLKSFLPILEFQYFNSNSYCTIGDGQFTRHFNERIFECFNCRFATTTFKELYLHNRKMHTKEPIRCIMCLAHFYTFSEVLCHVCPGERNRMSVTEVKYRCCLCDVDNIPSPFRMMVHLRKRHTACDVCLEDCRDQGRLSSHVWKHKLSHLCYRCGIAYRNKMDITKHLFWKHGTESINCKRCMQKRWRHVYHFCVPPVNFVCDVCQLTFSKSVYLRVHKRIHTGDFRYPCTDENCEEKFISRRLMLKHTSAEHPPEELPQLEKVGGEVPETNEEEKKAEASETGEAIKQEAVEFKKEDIEDCKVVTEEKVNETEPVKKETSELKKEVAEKSKSEDKTEEDKPTTTSTRKKKKKNKRAKESLEDLNLIAPNLSETDSSDDESGTETKSRAGEENELVPRVMLSPPSEAENDAETIADAAKLGNEADRTGKVLEIWKNFLQSQGGDAQTADVHVETEANYTEDNYPTPESLHVAYSDHDYCVMQRPETPPPAVKAKPSPSKRKNSTKHRTNSAHRGGNDSSSSSGDSSSSSSSSCCSRSNCSCSSSGSDSSSSSSSSDDSDSSVGSNASRKARQRKKSERDGQRKKSESLSPLKKNKQHHNSHSEARNDEQTLQKEEERPPSPPKEPLFYESDLETAESDTDEEFYDEHPQQLHTLLLAQKRAELMAQRRLSPSYNYDIVENSRPSTPSLPEEVAASAGAAHDKRSKLKKKKRERKSTSRAEAKAAQQQLLSHDGGERIQSSPGMAEPPIAQQPSALSHPQAQPAHLAPHSTAPNHVIMGAGGGRMSEGSSCSDADASLKRSKRVPRPNKFFGFEGEDENNGASASGGGNGGANIYHHPPAQPLMIGMRAFKPQPPPQLTWAKEDLPTPSKSILNNKNKAPRMPRTPASAPPLGAAGGLFISSGHSGTPLTSQTKSSKKKRPQQQRNNVTVGGGSMEKSLKRKRPAKKPFTSTSKLPPIPTLKIRGIGAAGGTNHIPASQIYSSSKESDDDSSADSSSAEEMSTSVPSNAHPKVRLLNANASGASSSSANQWNTTLQMVNAATSSPLIFQAAQVLPPALPTPPLPPPIVLPSAPPTPQASAFNHKIPPALLPNPDFATLQYFKANNIRYPIRPPAGARQPRDGESVYCYCRCPYDEVSEMIACDGENCLIEWFHFECVGIMVAPQGKWFCAECRPKYSEELYPNSAAH